MNNLPPWPTLSKIILFFFGLTGIAFEIVAEQTDRPTLLVLLGLMVGLNIAWLSPGRKDPPNGDDR